MFTLFYYFLFIYIYSFMGWTIEVIATFINDRKFVNRGFLIGPYCPIYGHAALLLYLCFSSHFDNLLFIFALSLILGSLLEYVTSYLMEKIFKARWWDYSKKPFNLNGRISLETSFLFGVLGVVIASIINPLVLKLLDFIPNNYIYILGFILLSSYITDIIISLNVLSKISQSFTSVRKDYTEDINLKIRELINDKSKLIKRLLKAFPNIIINRNIFKK